MYGAISENYETVNDFNIVIFKYVPYTIQEDVEPDGNKLAYSDLFCNTIYTYTVWHKSFFYVDPYIRQTTVTMSMKTVAIPNTEIKVWTRESDSQQEYSLRYLTQPEITRQRNFDLTDIEYDLINNLIARMECVEYITASGRNMMNVDAIEDYANFRGLNM